MLLVIICRSCHVTLGPSCKFFEVWNGEYNKKKIQPILNIFIFIIIYKPNNFGFAMFWNFNFKKLFQKLNFVSVKYWYWLE